jgi:hypothetical protein
MEFRLSVSSNPKKKFMVSFTNPKTNRIKTIHFGAKGYDDYITSKDQERKDRYLKRHKSNEDWDDLQRPGTWARYLLWNEPTLAKSIKSMQKLFKIKIIQRA